MESRPPLLSGDKLRTARENPRADQLLPLNPRGGVSEAGISIAGTSQLFGDRISSAYSDFLVLSQPSDYPSLCSGLFPLSFRHSQV